MTTAAERRAKIRERLKQAEEPPGTVEATTETFTEKQEEEYDPPATTNKVVYSGQRRGFARRQVDNVASKAKSAATDPRRRRPPNYKIHVLTALSLAMIIRVSRYGTKAFTG